MIPNPLELSDEPETLPAIGFEIQLNRMTMGQLILPSGKLVACDPLYMPETEPFHHTLETGVHDVWAVVADLRDDKRLAFVIIDVLDEGGLSWEEARLGDSATEEDGFDVNSSIACMMDVRSADALLDHYHYGDDQEFARMLRRELRKTRKQTGIGWANLALDSGVRANVVAFDAGEGLYPTHFGLTADGRVAKVVLDFQILGYEFTSFGINYDSRKLSM